MLIGLNCQIDNCRNFWWYEALFLASMDLYCWPNTMAVKDNIIKTARKLEMIREHLNTPLKVTSFYRPPHYNRMIHGSKQSMHMQGLACDFIPVGIDINVAKGLLKPMLSKYGIRLEDNGKGEWMHIDLKEPGKTGRYFKP